MPNKISDKGVSALMQREGVRLVAYQDTKNIWTIGVGHTGPEVKQGLSWTTEQVMQALRDDCAIAEKCVNENVKVPLTQNQFDALVSFVFNVGTGAFFKSTLLKLLNAGDYAGAGGQFLRWNIPPEIVGRRYSEQKQFNS